MNHARMRVPAPPPPSTRLRLLLSVSDILFTKRNVVRNWPRKKKVLLVSESKIHRRMSAQDKAADALTLRTLKRRDDKVSAVREACWRALLKNLLLHGVKAMHVRWLIWVGLATSRTGCAYRYCTSLLVVR